MSSQRNRKRLTKDMDRISNLPDAVLCLILTSLPTKCVVKTSILSKRWRYIWSKVPALDFTEMASLDCGLLSLEQMAHLRSFVDKLLLHNHASYIDRFCLDLVDGNTFYVTSWLIAAARRKIYELNISLVSQRRVRLPHIFFSSKCLVVLKLKGSIYISASASFHLPKLETIHLKNINFPDDEFMKRLCSSCPVLRELRIVNCGGVTTALCVESSSLKLLEIIDTIPRVDPLEQECLVIKTPNLTCFYLDDIQSLYDIGEMSSIIEADIDLRVHVWDVPLANSDYNSPALKLLTKLSGVKSLHLVLEVIPHERILPTFRNLTSLKCEASGLTCDLLRYAPKLKSLILQHFNLDYVFDPNLAPKQLPCLESVVVCCFSGIEDEMDTVAYFLKAASTLKEMKIDLVYYAMDSEIEIYQKLLDLPRSSAICRVKVV